jgi:hypothetical protein
MRSASASSRSTTPTGRSLGWIGLPLLYFEFIVRWFFETLPNTGDSYYISVALLFLILMSLKLSFHVLYSINANIMVATSNSTCILLHRCTSTLQLFIRLRPRWSMAGWLMACHCTTAVIGVVICVPTQRCYSFGIYDWSSRRSKVLLLSAFFCSLRWICMPFHSDASSLANIGAMRGFATFYSESPTCAPSCRMTFSLYPRMLYSGIRNSSSVNAIRWWSISYGVAIINRVPDCTSVGITCEVCM